MDIKIPVMNGVETFEGIRKRNPEATVMMMTVHSCSHKPLELLKVFQFMDNVGGRKKSAA